MSLPCLLFLSACAAPRLATVAKPASPPAAVLFSDVDVFDGEKLLRGRDVLVSQGKIESVAPAGTVAASAGAARVDGKGKTLLPGLVDIHVHFTSAGLPYWDLRRPDEIGDGRAALYAGVTTVLIANGSREEVAYARKAQAGSVLAPHVFFAGPALGAPGGHPGRLMKSLLPWPLGWLLNRMNPTARDAAEARAQVDRTAEKIRPQFYKVMYDDVPPGAPELSFDTLKAAIEESKAKGLRPIVHVGKPSDMADAARAGASLLMHTAYRGRLDAAQISTIKAAGIPFVTTLQILSGAKRSPGSFDAFDREVVEPAALESFGKRPAGWRIEGFEGMEAGADAFTEDIRANIRALAAAGVPFLAGTDTGMMGVFPGAALHRELKELAALGFSPAQVLRAATSAPADFLDPGHAFGRIAPGQRADLLLVRGDPTADLSAIDAIEAVYLEGVRLDRTPAPRGG